MKKDEDYMKKNTKNLKVLHDWDEPVNGGSWYFLKGIKYMLYGICKFLGFPFLVKDIAEEPKRTAILIAKLDKLTGVHGIFGIRDHVTKTYPDTVDELKSMRMEVRRHIHIGDRPDPNRKRLWDPPLNQPIRTWQYDADYISGSKVLLEEDELPIWHVNQDSSKNFNEYIKFLYNALVLEEDLYK